MKEKIIKIIKLIIKNLAIILWIVFILLLFSNKWGSSIFSKQIQEARDTSTVTRGEEIVQHLNTLGNYKFDNIVDYNDKYKWMRPYKNCYYLSPTEDRKDYILVQPLESKKYKKKMWGEFILHMSNPNYLITSQRWKEIMRVINDRCENIYK
jgi:hypothetical protein